MTARILIVDDTPFNVKLLETKLKQEYYEVFSVSNGVQALEQIPKIHPDIILLDVMMPIMDGMETARRIKADPETTHIPIIMVTSLDGQDDRVRGLEAGADDFLSKPIDEQALLTRIKSLLRLKLMMDELHLRDQTATQFGLIEKPTMGDSCSIDGANVLLIEDDIAMRKKVHAILNARGVNVDDCENPALAIEEAEKKDYSVVIVNNQVLGIDGLRVCSHFKSHDTLRHVSLLLSVDADNKNMIARGLEMGVNDYITMPIEVNELVARVSTQIRRKRYQDILRDQYAQSISMSVIDGLTGLYNRRYLDMHMASMIKRAHDLGKSLSILMIDLDHFKEVNDTYGHQSGDAVLQEIGKRILSSMRVTDLCARYGGEEFIVVMAETDTEQAQAIAERLRHSIEEKPMTLPVPPGQLDRTCSIGVAGMGIDDTAPGLVARADNCLYLAKEQGRNRVIVSAASDAKPALATKPVVAQVEKTADDVKQQAATIPQAVKEPKVIKAIAPTTNIEDSW